MIRKKSFLLFIWSQLNSYYTYLKGKRGNTGKTWTPGSQGNREYSGKQDLLERLETGELLGQREKWEHLDRVISQYQRDLLDLLVPKDPRDHLVLLSSVRMRILSNYVWDKELLIFLSLWDKMKHIFSKISVYLHGILTSNICWLMFGATKNFVKMTAKLN